MSDSHTTSRLINEQKQILAQAIVTAQYQRQSAEWSRYGQAHMATSVRDTGYHLDHLAQAIELDSLPLLIEYSAWCKTLFVHLQLPRETLEVTFECMREVLQRQLPADAAAVAGSYIDAVLQNLPNVSTALPSFLLPDAPFTELAHAYLAALLQYQHHIAHQLIRNAVAQQVRIQDIALHIFQVCQREIGRLWQTRQINVAQEHYATAVTQNIIAQLYPQIFAYGLAVKKHRVLIACAEGELHELGARILADFFEMDGWDTTFIGANTPTSGILELVKTLQPDLLCLSATTSMHLNQISRIITLVRALATPHPLPILVGGYAFNQVPNLWQQIGADGYAIDAQQTLLVAHEMVAGE